jgi:hypothetical protein
MILTTVGLGLLASGVFRRAHRIRSRQHR